MKKIFHLILYSFLGTAVGIAIAYTMSPQAPLSFHEETEAPPVGMGLNPQELQAFIKRPAYKYDTVSGHYLAGRFAQRHHDWTTASKELQNILQKTNDNDPTFLKRTMVLSMGAGSYAQAIALAKRIDKQTEGTKNKSALAALFIAIDDFKNQNYKTAITHIQNMPNSGLSNFIMPLLYSWANAALGNYEINGLRKNAAHASYFNHIIMISEFMDRKDHIETLITPMLKNPNITKGEQAQIADIYAHIGQYEIARALYKKIQATLPPEKQASEMNSNITALIKDLKNKVPRPLFEPIKTPEAGIARALYDMANMLTQDYNDESARVFSHMALYLDPTLNDAKFLLARIAARNGHNDEAITTYTSITQTKTNTKDYVESRRHAADLLEDQDKTEEAITLLHTLYKEHEDIESLIQIGDIHRRTENYAKAIQLYNKADNAMNNTIPAKFWYLHYMRGMAYEQMDNWNKAEQDLQLALKFQPDNPLVLNYLGYAWADQGEHLDKALELIQKAARLRPADGYITDSLGWILYRMNRFTDAIPHLEQAIELKPYDPVINDHLGDAYWRVGRRLEARFQWTRAKNHAEEDELKQKLEHKLLSGLPDSIPASSKDNAAHTAITTSDMLSHTDHKQAQ